MGKPHPLISDRRSAIYIYRLSSRRCSTLGTRCGERSMLATNLPPAERGSLDRWRRIQLNRLLVSYRCSVSVGLAAHSWKGQLWTWLLVWAALKIAATEREKSERYTRAVCSQPRGNHTVPSPPSRQLPELAMYFYMRGCQRGFISRRQSRSSSRSPVLPFFPQTFQDPHTGFDWRSCFLSGIAHKRRRRRLHTSPGGPEHLYCGQRPDWPTVTTDKSFTSGKRTSDKGNATNGAGS